MAVDIWSAATAEPVNTNNRAHIAAWMQEINKQELADTLNDCEEVWLLISGQPPSQNICKDRNNTPPPVN